jgi:predicted nucleotidyltransferase
MINDAIISVKDCILHTVGEDCEKIILFGSYAYVTQNVNSDYDFFVVLRDGSEKPPNA